MSRDIIVENREILLLKIFDTRGRGYDGVYVNSFTGMRAGINLLGRDVGRRKEESQRDETETRGSAHTRILAGN